MAQSGVLYINQQENKLTYGGELFSDYCPSYGEPSTEDDDDPKYINQLKQQFDPKQLNLDFLSNQQQSQSFYGFKTKTSLKFYSSRPFREILSEELDKKMDCQVQKAKLKRKQQNKVYYEEDLYVKDPKLKNQFLMMYGNQRYAPYNRNSTKTLKELKYMLSSKRACYSYGRYTQPQIIAALTPQKGSTKELQLNKLDTLYLAWTRIPTIVHCLNKLNLSSLRVVNLGGNALETIQPLTKLKAEKLQEVWIWNNDICEPKSFRKCNFPKLKVIDINTNKIKETESFKEIMSSQLENIKIDSNECINFYGFIARLTNNPKAKMNVIFNKCPQVMGFPIQRRRQKLTHLRPCIKNATYS